MFEDGIWLWTKKISHLYVQQNKFYLSHYRQLSEDTKMKNFKIKNQVG